MSGGFGPLISFWPGKLDIDTASSVSPQKCLVTGAGGFVGGALAEFLAARGSELTLLYRSAPPPEVPASTRRLDLATDPVDETLLQGVDVVYHCAGIAHQAALAEDYEAVNYQATLDLARRAESAGVSRFIFLSSVQAAPGAEPYGYWKWRAEEDLQARFSGSGMAVIALRPALVYGAGARGNLSTLVAAARKGVPVPPVGGRRSLVALPDLCECLSRLAGTDLSGFHRLVLSDGEEYTSQRLYCALRLALGRSRGVAWTPRWLWWLACRVLDLLRGGPRSPGSYDKLFGEAWYANDELVTLMNWRPQTRFEDLAGAMVGAGTLGE